MEQTKRRIRTIDITFLAFGLALFVVLSMCLRVPVFENYYLCLGYVVMTVYIWCFKWYEGAFIGFFGTILYGIVGGLGFNGLPGWAVGNIIIGLIIGLTLKPIKKVKWKTLQVVLTAVVAIIATFVGIELVKSIIDSFVVGQPVWVRMTKNFTSFIADAFVIVASLPICAVLDDYAKRLRYGALLPKDRMQERRK